MSGDGQKETATEVAVSSALSVPRQSRSPLSIISKFSRLTNTL